MSKFNMKGGWSAAERGIEKKTALFSVIRAIYIQITTFIRKLLSFLTLNVDTQTQYIHTIYIYTHTHLIFVFSRHPSKIE